MLPRPSIKQQFLTVYFEPLSREVRSFRYNLEERFELARERYEAEHRHQLPFSFVTFYRYYCQR
ncbi:hypothetical protein G8759_06150 [Spirosoma aureum]|uniref:Uncharacterized protein n=1 Tax=Spirosoma aureum TaxID=2692134 RepID=A0A6G9AIU2_9BACT|nr:hypothetical protein [Spirosoma aureum]QIP12239.1 hypothetical protein G8759_06150 [Spirosoma aureum]